MNDRIAETRKMETSGPERIDFDRYSRAAAFIPQRFSLTLTGAVGDGYWIDDHRYFHTVTECVEGRQRMVPCITDAVAGRVDPVIPVDTLAAFIGAHADKPIMAADMSTAQYDMPDANSLTVILGTDAYHIEIAGPKMLRAERLDPVVALFSPDGAKSCFWTCNGFVPVT